MGGGLGGAGGQELGSRGVGLQVAGRGGVRVKHRVEGGEWAVVGVRVCVRRGRQVRYNIPESCAPAIPMPSAIPPPSHFSRIFVNFLLLSTPSRPAAPASCVVTHVPSPQF